jgi:putative inorganic carbon (HCO3(-)) transporter
MSRRPPPRPAVANGTDRQHKAELGHPVASDRDPLSLTQLDWIALLLAAIALLIAPLGAGYFPTPLPYAPENARYLSTGLSAFLDLLGIPLPVALTAAAFGLMAWREGKRPVAIGAVRGMAGALIALAGWAILSLVRSHVLYLSLNALAVLLAALLLGGLASRLGRDRRGFIALLLALVAAGSIVAGLGVHEYLQQWIQGDKLHRVFATFANPDFLAGYLLLTLPLTLSAFVAATDRTIRLVLGVCLALQSGCLLFTGSRAGVGILLLALAIWLVLAALSGAAAGRWKPILAGLVVVGIGALLASAPLMSRVANTGLPEAPKHSSALAAVGAAAEAQSHSTNFRRYTWIGTVAMVKANPILGPGIGTYDTTYPRYAVTDYTAHAHNSFLQWAAETGVPGVLLLLTALAAATAFAVHVLLLPRRAVESEGHAGPPGDRPRTAASGPLTWTAGLTPQLTFTQPRLLLTGLLTAVLASMLHSLFDSDWYIVATLFTFSAVLALLVALSRDLAPLATQVPRPLSPLLIGGGSLVALFLLWRAGSTGMARLDMAEGAQAVQDQQAHAALDAYQAAAGADPLDPEPRLALAQLYVILQSPAEARQQLAEATHLAPIGKTFYRLGQFYVRMAAQDTDTAARTNDLNQAIAAFRHAREAQPNNVQNLRALAEAFMQAQQTGQAAEVYRTMIDMENGPFGKVRAVPERQETDFAYAHAGLADIAYANRDWSEAAKQDAQAAAILGAFWMERSWEINQLLSPDKRNALLQLYDSVLTQWQDALRAQGPQQAPQAAHVAETQRQFREEKAADDAKAQAAGEGTAR